MPTVRSSSPPTPGRGPPGAARPARAVPAAVERRAADQCNQPGNAAVEIVERQRAFTLRRAELHARDQAAEISVAGLAFTENGEDKGRDGLACPSRPSWLSRPSCLPCPLNRALRSADRLKC